VARSSSPGADKNWIPSPRPAAAAWFAHWVIAGSALRAGTGQRVPSPSHGDLAGRQGPRSQPGRVLAITAPKQAADHARVSLQAGYSSGAGTGCSSGSTGRVRRAVPLLRGVGQALGEQLFELGACAAPQEQGHAPVALGLPAAGCGAAGWPRGGPAPASPARGWFDTGRERDRECVPAGAPIRRLLAGSRLGARPVGNARARAWHRPQLPGNDHELTEPGRVGLWPALREARPGRQVPIPAARHVVKRPPARVAR